jgi:hypothetical protein
VTESEQFVSIVGVVHLYTDLGTFIDLEEGRRVFVPTGFMQSPSRQFTTSETVAIAVDQAFAKRERLTP